MAETDNIRALDGLIGKTVISRATGNKLGRVHDLIVDPVGGVLLGLSAETPEGGGHVIECREVYNFGPDAVMVNGDDSLSPVGGSSLADAPLAKKELMGASVVTEGGKRLGQVADIFVRDSSPPQVIYEVRESLLDKLLGRATFIPASAGRAVSADFKRIIVPDDTPGQAAESLDALSTRHGGIQIGERVESRDRGDVVLAPFEEGTIEVTRMTEEPVVSKRARVVEEVVINKEVGERTENISDTVRRTEVEVRDLEGRGGKNVAEGASRPSPTHLRDRT